MHILFLTDNFPPEVNAPASRTFEHCREWVKAGHAVTVITCAPNFPRGKVFEGYRNRPYQTETMAGIRVIRVWSYVTANEGFLRRVLDYLSFMASASLACAFVRRVDIVVGTSPQFFTACAAYFAGTLKRAPWIFELRDIWPESIKVVGAAADSPAIRLLERLEIFLYHRADCIVAVTHAFKKTLARRGVSGARIEVVTNGVDLSRFKPRPKDERLMETLELGGRFVAGYIGTHGMAHGLSTLLEAAALLKQRPDARDILILFLGDGACKAELTAKARVLGLDNVLFLDSVPKAQAPRYWSLLDVAVIHLRRSELFETVIPSKLFECMGMGIPVLHGVRGESADIVLGEGIGEIFEPEEAAQLAAGLVRMRDSQARRLAGHGGDYEKYRTNCSQAAKRYDRKHLALRMLEVIDKTVRRERRV